jgi:hypothetical protein
MNVLLKSCSLLALCAAAACGSKSTATPVKTPTATPTALGPVAHDAALAQLEAMRPFVVQQGTNLACDAYTPAASEVIKALMTQTVAARAEREKLPPEALSAWQAGHQAALGKLVDEVAAPLRKSVGCKLITDDKAWAHVAEGIVSIGEPLALPATIVKRRAMIETLLVSAQSVTKPQQCEGFVKEMTTTFNALDGDLKAMARIEQFVDDMVWEEQDETTLKSDPRMTGLMKVCGSEE